MTMLYNIMINIKFIIKIKSYYFDCLGKPKVLNRRNILSELSKKMLDNFL